MLHVGQSSVSSKSRSHAHCADILFPERKLTHAGRPPHGSMAWFGLVLPHAHGKVTATYIVGVSGARVAAHGGAVDLVVGGVVATPALRGENQQVGEHHCLVKITHGVEGQTTVCTLGFVYIFNSTGV